MEQFRQHSVRANGKTLPTMKPTLPSRSEEAIEWGRGDNGLNLLDGIYFTAVVPTDRLLGTPWVKPNKGEREAVSLVKKYSSLQIWNSFSFVLYSFFPLWNNMVSSSAECFPPFDFCIKWKLIPSPGSHRQLHRLKVHDKKSWNGLIFPVGENGKKRQAEI